MLMALLSGLTALCAPDQALASQNQASQVEVGEAQGSDAEPASYAMVFGPSWSMPSIASAPLMQRVDVAIAAAGVIIGVDRTRE